MTTFPLFLQVILCLLVIAGPMPLADAMARELADTDYDGSPLQRILVGLVVWFALQGAAALALGFVGSLRLVPAILVEIAFFVVGFVAQRFVPQPNPRTPEASVAHTQDQTLAGLLFGGLAVLGLLNYWIIVSSPITEFDSLAYHLPTVALSIQTGRFMNPDQYNVAFLSRLAHDAGEGLDTQNSQVGRYPYTWEVMSSLFVLPFGDDSLVALTALIAWGFLGLAVFLVAAELGAARLYSLAAAALVILLPPMLDATNALLVDLPLAAFFSAGVYVVLRFHSSRSVRLLVLLLVITGMLLSLKSSGIGYTGLLLTAVVVPNGWRSEKWRVRVDEFSAGVFSSRILLSFSGLLAGFLGLAWYVRNLIDTANPLGIVKVTIAGFDVFPGDITASEAYRGSLANLFSITNPSHWRVLLDAIVDKLGLPFALMVSLIAVALLLALVQRRVDFSVSPAMAVLMAGSFMLYWLTPYGADNGGNGWQITSYIAIGTQFRFAMPFLCVLGMVSGVCMSRFRFPADVLVALILVLIGIRLGKTGVMQAGLDIVGVVAIIAGYAVVQHGIRTSFVELVARRRRILSLCTALVVLAVLVSIFYVGRVKREQAREAYFGGIAQYIETNVPQGATIGYASSWKSYLFYGRRLDKSVLYVPARGASKDDWFKSLRQRDVKYVAVGPIGGALSMLEFSWLDSPESPFARVHGSDVANESLLYELR